MLLNCLLVIFICIMLYCATQFLVVLSCVSFVYFTLFSVHFFSFYFMIKLRDSPSVLATNSSIILYHAVLNCNRYALVELSISVYFMLFPSLFFQINFSYTLEKIMRTRMNTTSSGHWTSSIFW